MLFASAHPKMVITTLIPLESKARGVLEPATTAAATATRSNVKVRKLCSPDMTAVLANVAASTQIGVHARSFCSGQAQAPN